MGCIDSEIKQVPIEHINPFERNAKVHTKAQVRKIADSIQKFGFLNPLLIDHDYNLIAGHGRVQAAKKLGLKTVPCLFADGLTEAQRRAYILADNKLGELAEWDKDLVSEELSALKELDFDLDLTGFEESDIVLPSDDDGFTDDRDPSCQHNVFENQDTMQFPTESWYGMPAMAPTNTTGNKMLRFMDWNTIDRKERKKYIAHFYYDDYKFIAAWREPDKYLDYRLDERKS
ncbi:MAG: ParB N-terminal domain-containing protein [Lachnospiraceae bacterium]|nr:ParB N-terminal domain-containing protein [Lachnospiraceae bacterium]